MSRGLYVHVPFCVHKCLYCDFASGEFRGLDRAGYLNAVASELASSDELNDGGVVDTVFVGGGTPSLLEPEELRKLLEIIRDHLPDPGSVDEWSVEANPNSLTRDKAVLMRAAGVTRLSLGVQSLDPDELVFLERRHDPETALAAMSVAEEIFPSSWSCDLIYGIPGMTAGSWRTTLEAVASRSPSHVSAYELTVEEGTGLGTAVRNGTVQMQADAEVLRRQAEAVEVLAGSGLTRYEVSNWSRPGRECLHNDRIWAGGDYLGFGNGAHSRHGDRRWRNTASPMDYVERIGSGRPVRLEEFEDRSGTERLETTLLLGLRRRQGVPDSALESGWGRRAVDLWPDPPASWRDLVEFSGGVRLTDEGWCLLDRMVLELVSSVSDRRECPPAGETLPR